MCIEMHHAPTGQGTGPQARVARAGIIGSAPTPIPRVGTVSCRAWAGTGKSLEVAFSARLFCLLIKIVVMYLNKSVEIPDRVRAVVEAGLVNPVKLSDLSGVFAWRIDLLLYNGQVLGFDELLRLEQALDRLELPRLPNGS
jgi:hypothetical protein